jgi:uncharacterized coiled-coil protein SlyX
MEEVFDIGVLLTRLRDLEEKQAEQEETIQELRDKVSQLID